MKKTNKNNKKRYNVFSLRISEETKKIFKEARSRSGKSWNLFIYGLLKNKIKK